MGWEEAVYLSKEVIPPQGCVCGGGLVCSEEIRLTIQPTLTPALLPGLSALARRPTQQGAAAPISISWSAMGPAAT